MPEVSGTPLLELEDVTKVYLVYARVPVRQRRGRVVEALGEVGLSDREAHVADEQVDRALVLESSR